jgi:hypothetical protein
MKNSFLYKDVDPALRLGIAPTNISNIYITTCPECNHNIWDDECSKRLMVVKGFYDWNGFAVAVRECPKCFTRWWNHMDGEMYDTYVRSIQLSKEIEESEKTMQYADIFGQPLTIGDTVAFNPPIYKGITTGKVVDFTPKSVRVEYKTPMGSITTTIINPKAVVKKPA